MKSPLVTNPAQDIIQRIFPPSFRSWTAHDIYEYFIGRQHVHYFPVVDEGEAARDKMDRLLSNQFELNHQPATLSFPQGWLQNPTPDREWLFMLHKFYYGVGLARAYHETHDFHYAAKWIELTSSWMETVPLDFLPSRVAGRRIQNWIYAHYYLVTATPPYDMDPDFYIRFLDSLNSQVTHLLSHLDDARNHRTLELSAIFLAGVVFPELANAATWLNMARKALQDNLQEDLLPDGVHCELCTMYHHLVLKNYLVIMRLAKLNNISMPETMHRHIRHGLEFAMYVHQPDGCIPAIGDSDRGSYRALLQQGFELYGDERYLYVASQGIEGRPPDHRSKGFSDSGYYIIRSGWGDQKKSFQDEQYLLMDCGPLGEGNHGHLDALHIEVAAYGHSCLVDPGRYTYHEGTPNWRAWFRGTAAHNTVQVDGKDQTRYGPSPDNGKFVIQGPPPHVEMKRFHSTDGFDFLHGMATSAEYTVIHERKILYVCPDYWILTDILTATGCHHYDLLFHLSSAAHGAVEWAEEAGTLVVTTPHLLLAQPFDGETTLTVLDGYVSPSYGVKHLAPILQFSRQATRWCVHTLLIPFLHHPPQITLETLPLTVNHRPCTPTDASALRLTLNDPDKVVQDVCFMRHADAPLHYHVGHRPFQGLVDFFRMDDQGRTIKTFVLET